MSDYGDGFGPKKRKHEDVHIDFTPMIDCMFLLLMFNIMVYAISGGQKLDLPRARFSQGNESIGSTEIIIRNPTSDGYSEVLMKNRKAELDEIRAEIKTAVSNGRTNVVIRAERRVKIRDFMDVAEQIGAVPGTSLLVAVQHGVDLE